MGMYNPIPRHAVKGTIMKIHYVPRVNTDGQEYNRAAISNTEFIFNSKAAPHTLQLRRRRCSFRPDGPPAPQPDKLFFQRQSSFLSSTRIIHPYMRCCPTVHLGKLQISSTIITNSRSVEPLRACPRSICVLGSCPAGHLFMFYLSIANKVG